MRQFLTYGSVRGAPGNRRPYRDQQADGAAEAKGKACLAPTTRGGCPRHDNAGRMPAPRALPGLQRGEDARATGAARIFSRTPQGMLLLKCLQLSEGWAIISAVRPCVTTREDGMFAMGR